MQWLRKTKVCSVGINSSLSSPKVFPLILAQYKNRVSMVDNFNLFNFILGGSKITVDGDCSHEIKRRLVLGRKAMTNLERDITLPAKVCLVKAMAFPKVMYGCESWAINKAEC